MTQTLYTNIELSRFGTILALSDGQALTGLYVVGQKHVPAQDGSWQYAQDLPVFAALETQLQEFLGGKRRQFDIPCRFVCGTPFQQKVWQALTQIPYGQKTSYGSLAQSLGMPKSVRAVGAAIGRNPLLVLVPCHRVVGSTGSLTGFAAGLELKASLLELEFRSL